MESSVPPQLRPLTRRKKPFWKIILLIFCLAALLITLAFAVPTIMGFFVGSAMFAYLEKSNELHFKSYTDTFQVRILEVKSEPNFFEERIHVRCMRDMDAGLWVTDLKLAGIFKTNAPTGQIIYHEGRPYIIGSVSAVQAKDSFSNCEMLFRITTSSTNTAWHSEGTSGGCDTALSIPLTISNVQTNWTGSYERGTEIPLANLGDYKILLSVK